MTLFIYLVIYDINFCYYVGVLNVCESPTKQKWRKCICTIIDGQFKVYREATAKAIPVLTFSLQSLEIQPASSDTKRSLAIKLMPADSGPILVEVSHFIRSKPILVEGSCVI